VFFQRILNRRRDYFNEYISGTCGFAALGISWLKKRSQKVPNNSLKAVFLQPRQFFVFVYIARHKDTSIPGVRQITHPKNPHDNKDTSVCITMSLYSTPTVFRTKR